MRILCLLIMLSSCSVNKKTSPIHPFIGDQVGCGNFIAYKLSKDNTEFISVAFKANDIEYKLVQTFGVGKTDLLEVKWKKFERAINQTLCNDLGENKIKNTLALKAISGLVEIRMTETELEKAARNDGYRATITLRNVVFENKEIDFLVIENIYLGWLPG